mgnify:FL=1
MNIEKTELFEKAVVKILNLDGWQLKHIGGTSRYDAKGLTPKGYPAVIEMKFRNKYYENKMIEKKKYDALMNLPNDVVKLYFVADSKGNYLFWLNNMTLPPLEIVLAGKTTYWGGDKESKEVYYLPESKASIVSINTEDPEPGPWTQYFANRKKS